MTHTNFGSLAAARLERHVGNVIRMRPIFPTLVIAATVVSALAITPPALARSGSGAGGPVGASSSAGSGGSSYNNTRGPYANGSAVHRFSGTGSPPVSSNPSRSQGWHQGSTPPGWTGHGEKRGWDEGRMPPGLSHHDRDLQSHQHWGDERGNHERAQFETGQLDRRRGW
jgi:hypothetical protein